MIKIDPEGLNLKDKVVYINRVAKVVKGGRRFSFTALVVVGDGEGAVGTGKGKASEVPEAIRKAVDQAKKSLIRFPIKDTTIPHRVIGRFGSGTVVMNPAQKGTGIIADVDSVKTKGIKQEISVDAINSISILGTGFGLGGMLNAGIKRFFKEYPYSRIGIQCTLENDNFSIRGKIHEGGKNIVRRAFLRGVDVGNQNPQNVISFKDMQERIRRISKSNKIYLPEEDNMKKKVKFLLLGGIVLILSCVTVNIYFPAAEVQKAADVIVEDVRQLEKKQEQKPLAQQKINQLYQRIKKFS